MDEHYTGRRKKDGTPWLASGKNASIKLLQISVNIGEVDDDGKPITKMTDEELVKLYKDDIYPMLEDEYGRENIVGAAIHLDESKPHLHIDVVPLTEDGRLSAKEVVGGKGKMHQNQSRWLEKMQEKRPDLNFVRKKDGVNGLELDKLKELTAIAEEKGEEKALNVLMSMHKQEKKKWDKEWARIETADKELDAKAKEVAEQEQKNDTTRDELNAFIKPLKSATEKLAEQERAQNKRERAQNERETALNGRERALKGRENMLNERTRALDERESRLNETADKLADERTRERTNALDERESRLNETADKLADERTRERTNALDERESRLNETADKLADERTRERTRALDVRESQLDQEVETRVSKIKSAFVGALKQLPKIKDTLVAYMKKAREKDEEERKAREEQAERLAEITDVKTEQLADAIEREDIKQVAKHTEHLEQINEVSTEIDESQFEMSADTLENKIDNLEIEIDESQFEVSNPSQKTL